MSSSPLIERCEATRRRRTSHHRRWFSVSDANEMLPLVERIVTDIVALSRSLNHHRYRLRFITADGDEIERMFPVEVGNLRSHLHDLETRLNECVTELLTLGVEPELPSLGLVDFPSRVDDQPALLCWKTGESEIAWWHGERGGFVDRRPLSEPRRRANTGTELVLD